MKDHLSFETTITQNQRADSHDRDYLGVCSYFSTAATSNRLNVLKSWPHSSAYPNTVTATVLLR